MPKGKLNLDKERLLHLQAEQMSAINGGNQLAAGDVEFTKPIDIQKSAFTLNGTVEPEEATSKSCCKKSC